MVAARCGGASGASMRAACIVAVLLLLAGGAGAQQGGIADPVVPGGPTSVAPDAAPPDPLVSPPVGNAFSVGTDPEADAQVTHDALLVVDQDRLYSDSRFGAASRRTRESDERTLEGENRRIEAALEAEERSLTDRRATLPAEEFRALAAAFDARVEDIRSAQDGKAREIARRQDDDRKRFFAAAVPVLADLMGDLGAVALLDTGTVLLSLDRIDITDDAIGRIDAVLGDGSGAEPPEPPPAPSPGQPAPGPDPTNPDPADPGPAAPDPGP